MSSNRYHYTESGLPNIWLRNGFVIEQTPYGEAVSIHDLDGLHRAIGLSLIESAAPLSPAEFKFLRVEMDMSQKALARLLDVTEQTVSLYERQGNIPGLTDRSVRQFYREYCNIDGKFRDLVEEFVALDNQIQDLGRDLDFAETPDGWRPQAA